MDGLVSSEFGVWRRVSKLSNSLNDSDVSIPEEYPMLNLEVKPGTDSGGATVFLSL